MDESTFLERAAAGDQQALTLLLLDRYEKLTRYVSKRIPDDLASAFGVEDVIQDVHVEAFRTIARFREQGDSSFDRWLCTIAGQRLLDRIKSERRKKRGGGRLRVQKAAAASSIGTLLDVLAVSEKTPSRSVARHERERAVAVGLANLREEYREALRLRYLEGRPIAEIAAAMGKTDRAVHMLCNRGLKKLREELGRSSKYFSFS